MKCFKTKIDQNIKAISQSIINNYQKMENKLRYQKSLPICKTSQDKLLSLIKSLTLTS